jgi:HSP20 family molecular chaperone IbpA
MVLNQTLGMNTLRQDLNRLFYAAPIGSQAFAPSFLPHNFYSANSFYGTQPWALNSFYAHQAWAPAQFQAGIQQQPMMGQPVHFVPRCNVAETHEAVIYTVELPGVELSQCALSIHGNILVLEGVRQPGGLIADRMISYQQAEGRFGSFRWVAPIPNGIVPAAIDASLRQGLLTICLPKAGAQVMTGSLNNQAAFTQAGFNASPVAQAAFAAGPVAQVVISQPSNA